MQLIEQLKAGPVYIMPVNLIGVVAYHILKKHGIAVSGFLDNDGAKHDKTYDCVPVLAADGAYIAGATVVLCTVNHEDVMRTQLLAGRCGDIVSYQDVFDLGDIKEAASAITPDVYNLEATYALSPVKSNAAMFGALVAQSHYIPGAYRKDRDALIFNLLDVSVTSRCSLRCRDCVALMQYYRHPADTSADRILRSIDSLLQHVDYISALNIIGGEPLIHKNISDIIDRIGRFRKKIGVFSLTTNGTILPSDAVLRSAKENDMQYNISFYGDLSRNMEKTVEKLEAVGISYAVKKADWYDWCKIIDGRARGPHELQEMYGTCRMLCYTLRDDKLFRCPFIAHADAIHAIPFDPENYLSLDSASTSKAAIREFAARSRFFPGCVNCSGHVGKLNEKVLPAIQADKPLDYIPYTYPE